MESYCFHRYHIIRSGHERKTNNQRQKKLHLAVQTWIIVSMANYARQARVQSIKREAVWQNNAGQVPHGEHLPVLLGAVELFIQ